MWHTDLIDICKQSSRSHMCPLYHRWVSGLVFAWLHSAFSHIYQNSAPVLTVLIIIWEKELNSSSELLQEQMLADVSVTELQLERSVSRISIRIHVRVIIMMSVGSHSRLLWTDSSSKSINMFSCFHHDEEQKLWGFSWTDYSKSSTASALYSTYYSVNNR